MDRSAPARAASPDAWPICSATPISIAARCTAPWPGRRCATASRSIRPESSRIWRAPRGSIWRRRMAGCTCWSTGKTSPSAFARRRCRKRPRAWRLCRVCAWCWWTSSDAPARRAPWSWRAATSAPWCFPAPTSRFFSMPRAKFAPNAAARSIWPRARCSIFRPARAGDPRRPEAPRAATGRAARRGLPRAA